MRSKLKFIDCKVAIIGHGFVGKAVDYGFSNPKVEKRIFDPKYGTTSDDIKNLPNWGPNITFVCVPTPMGDNGDIDSTILDEVMNNLKNVKTLIVIKSTITPLSFKKQSP